MRSDNGYGFFLGIIVLIIFIVLLFIYGLPYLRGAGSGTPQVNVPGQIDVNVNKGK